MPLSAGLQVGRNSPCPCGSGKKFKKCCLNLKREIEKDIANGAEYVQVPGFPGVIKIKDAPQGGLIDGRCSLP